MRVVKRIDSRWAVLSTLLILVSASMALAGCVGKGPESSEEDYWGHIRASGELSKKLSETKKEVVTAAEEENYAKAIELVAEMEKMEEEALEHAQSAVDLANTPSEKRWAECLFDAQKYSLQYVQKLGESIELKKDGKDEEALESINTANDFAKKFLELVQVCSELKP